METRLPTTSPITACFLSFLRLYIKVAVNTNETPTTMSTSSPTQPVEVIAILRQHFITMITVPLIGPNAKPPIIAGRSDICISRNDGNIKGKLNLQNA
ncbi:unknown [Acidaminococcus sp. CAG:917]|nr:unknown [Acidaminococcus sp. CAG:917]